MICINCQSPIEDGAKFCPNCGAKIEPLTEIAEEDIPSSDAESFSSADTVSEFKEETPTPEDKPESGEAAPEEPVFTPVVPVFTDDEPAQDQTVIVDSSSVAIEGSSKPLHFTATVTIVLTALAILFGAIASLGGIVAMHPAIIIIFSILDLLVNPFAFGFGVAAFIVGLKKKKPATWIVGLVAAILAVIHWIYAIIMLLVGIIALVA